MTAAHFLLVLQAELRKLWSRTAARLGIYLSALIGILMPIAVFGAHFAGHRMMSRIEINGPGEEVPWVPIDLDQGLIWALGARNFFILAAFIILLTGVSFAGEYQNKTLREDLLRPVPRWGLLMAKWLALVLWAWASLAVLWLPCVFESFVMFRGEGDMLAITLGYGATALGDMALVSLVLGIAVVTRSVPFTLMGAMLFYVLDYALGTVLNWFPVGFLPRDLRWIGDWLEAIVPFMFSSAWNVWKGYKAHVPWSWEGFATLAIVTLVGLLVSLVMFRRMDVP